MIIFTLGIVAPFCSGLTLLAPPIFFVKRYRTIKIMIQGLLLATQYLYKTVTVPLKTDKTLKSEIFCVILVCLLKQGTMNKMN